MFGDNITFDHRARFLYDNVLDIPFGLQDICGVDVALGLVNLRNLLLDIYLDIDSYKVTDTLESYHNITNMVYCFLYSIAIVGELVNDESKSYIKVRKSDFKKVCKKSISSLIKIIKKYSIDYIFYKQEKEVEDYKKCDTIQLYFGKYTNLPHALKYISKSINDVDKKNEYSEHVVMFGKADYKRLVLNKPAMRSEISPLRSDILKSTGYKKEIYQTLIGGLLQMNLSTNCYLSHYCCPFWNVNFLKGKKLVCKTMIFYDYIQIQVPIPKKPLEQIVLDRANYPQSIVNSIENFGCIKCGKCQKDQKSYLKFIDGVKCCFGRADTRTIHLSLSSIDEVDAIIKIIRHF